MTYVLSTLQISIWFTAYHCTLKNSFTYMSKLVVDRKTNLYNWLSVSFPSDWGTFDTGSQPRSSHIRHSDRNHQTGKLFWSRFSDIYEIYTFIWKLFPILKRHTFSTFQQVFKSMKLNEYNQCICRPPYLPVSAL